MPGGVRAQEVQVDALVGLDGAAAKAFDAAGPDGSAVGEAGLARVGVQEGVGPPLATESASGPRPARGNGRGPSDTAGRETPPSSGGGKTRAR